MTINTTAPHTSNASMPPIFPGNLPWQHLLAALTLFCLFAAYRRTRRRLVFATLLLFFSVGIFAGCGGGSSMPPVVQIPGTAAGTYIFTVTASTPGPNAALPVVGTQTTVTVTVQ
jgi:hypothetical protein